MPVEAAARLPSVPSPVEVDARVAALPAGVLALTLLGAEAESLARVRASTRQAGGRAVPGRPHVGRQELLQGFIVDLREVFAADEALVYALGIGTNVLATNVHLGALERQLGAELGARGSAVQSDALIFPPPSSGMQQAHGHVLVHRDGRMLFQARDNGSVFARLATKTLYFPDIEEPNFHPPIELEPGVAVPLQSGSALAPGGVLGPTGPSPGSTLLRLAWKPFGHAAPVRRSVAPRRRSESPAEPVGTGCAWRDGPLG